MSETILLREAVSIVSMSLGDLAASSTWLLMKLRSGELKAIAAWISGGSPSATSQNGIHVSNGALPAEFWNHFAELPLNRDVYLGEGARVSGWPAHHKFAIHSPKLARSDLRAILERLNWKHEGVALIVPAAPNTANVTGKRAGGRPVTLNWFECAGFLAAYVAENDYPKKQSDLVNQALLWFGFRELKTPDRREIERVVNAMYAEHERLKASRSKA